MKKTQRKDTIRNIGREKVSYLSILIIAMLAVTMYLGINFGSEGLKANADRYYQQTRFRDFEIMSTLLLSEEDLDAVRAQEGIADVEGLYSTDGKAVKGGGSQSLTVVSLTERINTPAVIEGRLPENAKECAVEDELLSMLSLNVGDMLTVTDAQGSIPLYLLNGTYRITGRVYHPDHYALNDQVPANRYVVVTKDAFDAGSLDGCYMKAEVRIDKPEGISYFNKKYRSQLSAVQKDLEAFCREREALRTKTIRDRAEAELADAESELADGKKDLDDGRAELDENTKKIEDGEAELADAEEQLADAQKEIEDGEAELADAKKQLDEGKQQLDDAQKELAEARTQLVDAKAELDSGASKLSSGRKSLQNGAAQLTDAKKQLADSYNEAEYAKAQARYQMQLAVSENVSPEAASSVKWAKTSYIKADDVDKASLVCTNFAVTESYTIDLTKDFDSQVNAAFSKMGLSKEEQQEAYDGFRVSGYYDACKEQFDDAADKAKQWNKGHETYLKQKKNYENGLSAYNTSLEQYNSGLKKYNAGLEEYEEGLKTYNEKKAEYEDGVKEYEDGLKKIEDAKQTLAEKTKEYEEGIKELEEGKEELAKGEKDYAEGLADYEQGRADYADAKETYDALNDARFILMSVTGNGSFLHAENSAVNVGKIGVTFALLFVLIGALVIYATIGRIIGEQRPLVGTQKALGLFNSEIFRKYLSFGVSASLIGIIAGMAVGYGFVQRMVLVSHEQFYVTGVIPRIFRPVPALIVTVCGIVLAAAAVYWACLQLLREPAKNLMQEQAPSGRKKAEKKEKKGSLYSRLIVRNMRTDWQRVLITIVSVAGCCVLLVIGFTLRDSIYNCIDRQFTDIFHYTDRVFFDAEASEDAEEEIGARLADLGIENEPVMSAYRSFSSPEGLTGVEMVCVDSKEQAKYFHMYEVDGKTEIVMGDEGVYIPRNLSEFHGLNKGDAITVYDTAMMPHDTVVAGVFEYYYGTVMVISREAYRNVYGEECPDNAFWIKKTVSDGELLSAVSSVKGFSEIESRAATQQRYLESVSVLSLITAMMIAAAGMMAFFVLLNLVNMYLTKKKKELTVMRINGFTTKEVVRYVAGESVVTTVFGILLGLLAGGYLGYTIIRFIEQQQLGLMRGIDLKGWLIAALLTGVFSGGINALALRKIKHLKLSDMNQ